MEIVYNRFHLYNSIPMHYIYIYIPILLVPKDCYDSNFELNDSNDLDFLNLIGLKRIVMFLISAHYHNLIGFLFLVVDSRQNLDNRSPITHIYSSHLTHC